MRGGDGRMIFIKGKEKLLGLLRTCHTAAGFNSRHAHQRISANTAKWLGKGRAAATG